MRVARIAWIRNQLTVTAMMAMNGIDQTPASRCKSPQKMRLPLPVRRRGRRKARQNRL